MRPTIIPDELAASHPGLRRIVVSGPSGDLLADGSTPHQAQAVEALAGLENNWPLFIERWVLELGDLETLQAGGQIELWFWIPQLPVHAMHVAT